MADECPNGGKHLWVKDKENGKWNGKWKCRQCGQYQKEEKEEKQITIPSWGKSIALPVIGGIIFFVLYTFSPLPQIISLAVDLWTKYAIAFLPEGWVLFVAQFFIWWLLGVIVTMAVIFMLLTKPDPRILASYLGTNLIVADVIFFFSLVFWYAIITFPVFYPYICISSNLFTLSQISPTLAQNCVQYQSSQVPDHTKQGTATPLTISFGYTLQQTGQNLLPTLYQGYALNLPVNLVNNDKTQDLTGVVVKGYIDNGTCSPGFDCVDMIAVGSCTTDNPCTILAGKFLQITLQSSDVVADRIGTWDKVEVQVSYQGIGFGKANLYVARSLQDVGTLSVAEPESGTGPLDVVIYFAPSFYVPTQTSSTVQNQGCAAQGGTCRASCLISQKDIGALDCVKQTQVSSGTLTCCKTQLANEVMYVAVANAGDGIGKLGGISINRIGTYEALDKVQCPIPWKTTETITEGTPFDLQSIAIPKGSNIQFPCTVDINNNNAKILLNNFQETSQSIPFTATVSYNYFESAEYVPDKSVQQLGIPQQ